MFYLGVILLIAGIRDGRSQECSSGFSKKVYTFIAHSQELVEGEVLGKVEFHKCEGSQVTFHTTDSSFRVMFDGTVCATESLRLLEKHCFVAIATEEKLGSQWASDIEVSVTELLKEVVSEAQYVASPDVEVSGQESKVPFPRPRSVGHKIWKRHWERSPIRVPENQRGSFPKKLVQVRSNSYKEGTVLYSITGPGADETPVSVFVIDRKTAWLSVTQSLDREEIQEYRILVHITSESGEKLEDPQELVFKVVDQNDNPPQFTQKVFTGFVQEGAEPGTAVMQVNATDSDDPDLDNALIGYAILNQEPKEPTSKMFNINKETGVISVEMTGLDRESCNISETSSPLTTHVLNMAQGIPARNMKLTVSQLEGTAETQNWKLLKSGLTNSDGRCPGLLTLDQFSAGTYKMQFETAEYWKGLGLTSFYPYVEIVFSTMDPSQKYHVPLLLSPFSYSTYRGS
ncbi:cadherin-1 isoform X2 [Latimeria chalumnae]|uniref:cadherin-1 isoform X2 n=1 Tax=Latimeria chalumnae TaxID=7897 RepID=UPI0003C10734|nr:PREDICTED: cadherin-1-like isoform X2 [Latimeria chalumnae]|eukprot:XP_006009667.1 PREDICTED: cadherin-1-like isoform X2 [Latimeria chalumnae]